MAPLSLAELAELRKCSSPTLSNAIERFGVRPKNQGFMSPEIRCIFPDLAPLVGYAVTCTVAADQPDALARARGLQPAALRRSHRGGTGSPAHPRNRIAGAVACGTCTARALSDVE